MQDRLVAAGHRMLTPTLARRSDRSPAPPPIGLIDHIDQIVDLFIDHDLHDVILVGHSYAGMVVTNVAAALPDRVAQLIIVDGFLPEAGEVAIELLPDGPAAHYRSSRIQHDGSWWIPPRPLKNLGVTDPAVIAETTPRLVPQPMQTYLDPSPRGASELAVPGRFLLCAGWATPFRRFADRAGAAGWQVVELPADHEVILTDPELLADQLLARDVVASGTERNE